MAQPPARRPQLRPQQQPSPQRRIDLGAAIERGQYEVFQQLLKIDKYSLDSECEDFADIYYHISDALATLMSRRDGLSQDIKNLEAELYADMRVVPDGQKKPTEKEIAAEIRLHPQVQGLRNQLDNTNTATGKLMALKEAFGQRSHMLSNLVTLAVSNYYSQSTGTPRGPAREQQLEDSREHVLANQPREYPRRAAPQRNR